MACRRHFGRGGTRDSLFSTASGTWDDIGGEGGQKGKERESRKIPSDPLHLGGKGRKAEGGAGGGGGREGGCPMQMRRTPKKPARSWTLGWGTGDEVVGGWWWVVGWVGGAGGGGGSAKGQRTRSRIYRERGGRQTYLILNSMDKL